MFEPEFKSKDQWEAQRRVIARYGNESLRCPQNDLLTPDVASKFDKYEWLALKRFHQFCQTLRTSEHGDSRDSALRERLPDSPAVQHGFLVAGRLINYGKQAYLIFCEKDRREASIPELIHLLKSQQAFEELALFLAKLPNPVNREYEMTYSLTSLFYSSNSIPPFIVQSQADNSLVIFPQEALEDQALHLTHGWRKNSFGDYAVCPAHKVFLRRLWDSMLDECAADPSLFAADFVS